MMYDISMDQHDYLHFLHFLNIIQSKVYFEHCYKKFMSKHFVANTHSPKKSRWKRCLKMLFHSEKVINRWLISWKQCNQWFISPPSGRSGSLLLFKCFKKGVSYIRFLLCTPLLGDTLLIFEPLLFKKGSGLCPLFCICVTP